MSTGDTHTDPTTHTAVPQSDLAVFAAAATCPTCGGTGFDVTWRLIPAEPGTYSLAGVQDKVAATETPVLVCASGCGTEKVGKR